jgi:uncharacterized membrane protein YphA (DoxX/SURF4 family)
MRIIRIIARPLVAAPFVIAGVEALRNPGPRAEKAAPVLKPLADRVSWLPSKDPETLVRMQGALSVGAGTLLALGRFQRLTTLLLAADMVPSLLTEHRFWEEDDPALRASERILLLKDASLFGALLIAGAAPSGRHPVRAAKSGLHEARLQAALAKSEAGRQAERARHKASKRVSKTQRQASAGVARSRRKAAKLASR